jgi:AcrR family transcriptional regulator
MSSKRQTKADVVVDFRRAQILDAARQSFVKRGVAATTVDAVAKAAGVAKGTVYLYFDSKDAILREILTQDLQEFHDCTMPAIRQAGPPRARVEAYFRAALEFFERKRDFFEHCHLEMTPAVRQKAKSELGLVFAAQAEAWRDVLTQTPAAVAGADAEGLGRAIVSLAHGLALQRLRGWQTGSIDDTVAVASHLVLKGVTRA